ASLLYGRARSSDTSPQRQQGPSLAGAAGWCRETARPGLDLLAGLQVEAARHGRAGLAVRAVRQVLLLDLGVVELDRFPGRGRGVVRVVQGIAGHVRVR